MFEDILPIFGPPMIDCSNPSPTWSFWSGTSAKECHATRSFHCSIAGCIDSDSTKLVKILLFVSIYFLGGPESLNV